ncbi:TPA: SDR family NAD(P)-dependent oxidoreductase [Pseudomonas putida]|nr:SDR family NAD(P)-dependent oxidoreductase [Pseudomonas putida]HEN8715943.1 SDR family NAD(P)-dependent oxidoreductase [Pseudomonas putida]
MNVASIGALRGAAFALSYAASRAAVVSMTKSAALDWASRKCSIRVNAVLPGSVRTELSQQTNALTIGFTLPPPCRTLR